MEWISVKDGFPEEGCNVIVWCQENFNGFGNCGHSIAYYCNESWWGGIGLHETTPHLEIYYADGGQSRMDSQKVTHWMTLPEPPKEE